MDIWLQLIVLLLAAWISFVKSSIQAAACLLMIFLIVGLQTQTPGVIFLGLGAATLCFASLLIPKPNPRHQRRRFQFAKLIYSFVFLGLGWVLNAHLTHQTSTLPAANLDPLLSALPVLSFLVLIVLFLLTRKHAS